MNGVTLSLKKTPSLDYNLPDDWRHSLTHLFNHNQTPCMIGQVFCIQVQYCAREASMSMLMKLSCARAHGGVTRTTTLGQYASWNMLNKLTSLETTFLFIVNCILSTNR